VGLVDFRTRARMLTPPDSVTGYLRRPRGLAATGLRAPNGRTGGRGRSEGQVEGP
jgi:hypothetical protein